MYPKLYKFSKSNKTFTISYFILFTNSGLISKILKTSSINYMYLKYKTSTKF